MPEHQWPRSNCLRESDMLRRIRREISNKRRNRFWYRWIHSWPELQRKPLFRSLRESSNDSTCIDPLASLHQDLIHGKKRTEEGCITEDFPKSLEDRLASKRAAFEDLQFALTTDEEFVVSL